MPEASPNPKRRGKPTFLDLAGDDDSAGPKRKTFLDLAGGPDKSSGPMDKYAEALGFGDGPAAESPPMDRYAAALGFPRSASRPTFGELFASDDAPKSFGALFGEPSAKKRGVTVVPSTGVAAVDPYAVAAGFDGSPPVSDGRDPYAIAAGFTGKPKKRAAAADVPSADVPGGSYLQQSPATQAAINADIRRTGAQNPTVNGQPIDSTAVAPPVAPPAPVVARGPTDANGIPVAPGANTTPSPSPDVPWWQKGFAGFQAGANALTGATTGAVGGLVTGGNTAVQQVLHLASGTPMPANLAGPNAVQDAAGRGAAALTTPLTSQTAQDYAEAIAKNKVVQSLPAVGAHATSLVPANRSMAAMQRQFEEAKRAQAGMPRIEPTMGAAPIAEATLPNVTLSGVPEVAGAFKPPTLADAPPQLQQAVAAAKAKGAPINPVVLERHIEAQTLPVPGQLTAGQAALDPVLVSKEMNSRGKGSPPVPPEFYQQQGKVVAQNAEAIRAAAAPDVSTTASLVDHGQTLLDAYKAHDAPLVAEITAKYKALADANGGELPLSGQDFAAAADAALRKQMKGRYVPAAVAGDLEGFRNGGPMTFEDFENLRTNLAAEARKSERAGDGNAAGAVNIVRNALEALPMTNETAAVKPLADAARSAARARFEAINADPAYKAAINDAAGQGEPSALADKFFRSYVTNGARANVAKMAETLGADPVARQTIAAGTLDQLKAQLKADPNTGNFSQDAYNRALQSIAPKLDTLLDPKTAYQAKALGNFAKYAQVQPRGSFVNNSNTFVASAAKGLAEMGANVLVPGANLGTKVRDLGGRVGDRLSERKATRQSLAPGAGMTNLRDVGK